MATLTLSPGNTLAYEHVPPATNGKTFVCFNALSGDMTMWPTAIGDALRQEGHGWLIYNMRGQAGSSYTISAFDEAQIVADACALLDHVKPANPVHVGLSIGGLFALRTHLTGGSAAGRGFVLINTLRKASPRLDWINDAVVRVAETGGMELLKDLYSPLLMNEEWQQANRAAFLHDGGYKPCASDDPGLLLLKAGPSANWDVPYEQISEPTLIVSGLQDRVFYHAEHVNELARRLPRVEFREFANAGHMIPVERPNELADAIVTFARSF